MVTNRKLTDYLPSFLQEYRELNAIMEAEQPEINSLWDSAEQTLANQFVSIATENGVKRWESMLGISPKGTDTVDERKFRILTKVNHELPYSLRKLEHVLTNLCGVGGFYIEVFTAEYHVEVKLAVGNHNNYSEVENILNKMIPANMTRHIELMYNTHTVLSQMTHAQLSAYTHEQLRNEVFK